MDRIKEYQNELDENNLRFARIRTELGLRVGRKKVDYHSLIMV